MSSNHNYSSSSTKNDALRKHHEIKSLKIRLLKEPNKPVSIETHSVWDNLPLYTIFCLFSPLPIFVSVHRKNRNLKP